MKKILCLAAIATLFFTTITAFGQEKKAEDKTKRPSPPAKVTQTLKSGAVITIDYSQPSVKGRTIGKDVEPMGGKVWRTGANEATVFETSQKVKINGKQLAAGKYGFFTIDNGKEWTIIFNKTWDQWGAFDYKSGDDVLKLNVKAGKADPFSEKMTFTIDENGQIDLMWGDKKVGFTVK